MCRTSSVPDLGEAMVREGLAVNFGGRTEGPYQDAEIEAEGAKRGLWAEPSTNLRRGERPIPATANRRSAPHKSAANRCPW